ncbi:MULTISPECIES: hypothetical protein [unclassified Pseudomonas]|uniref:hypothetical protein n=1 Tax=unclassified Pseudomonas TaxID=196821 RepID=UPI00117A3917|nr:MULTISPECIES: hypothetical protein [unclassified Pseudomonas]
MAHTQQAPSVSVGTTWQPLTGPGQIQQGTWLSFTVGGKFFCARAKLVIDPGTDNEEVVYNRKKNHYFVTSMAVDGTSNHKGVLVALPVETLFQKGYRLAGEGFGISSLWGECKSDDELPEVERGWKAGMDAKYHQEQENK